MSLKTVFIKFLSKSARPISVGRVPGYVLPKLEISSALILTLINISRWLGLLRLRKTIFSDPLGMISVLRVTCCRPNSFPPR